MEYDPTNVGWPWVLAQKPHILETPQWGAWGGPSPVGTRGCVGGRAQEAEPRNGRACFPALHTHARKRALESQRGDEAAKLGPLPKVQK